MSLTIHILSRHSPASQVDVFNDHIKELAQVLNNGPQCCSPYGDNKNPVEEENVSLCQNKVVLSLHSGLKH